MARIFISHSSKDNFEAIAMQDWLVSEGWARDDVFLDLHGIGAGARWKEALAKANERCEAVLFLVSPHSLASNECYVELRMAEDMGKVILPAILPARAPEDEITIEDDRLAIHRDRQIVDASIEPREANFTVEHEGKQRTVAFHAPTLSRIKARLEQLGIAPTSFPWTPVNLDTATPYPGLEGFATGEAALFFGRAGDIARGFAALRKLRRAVLAGGVGKILVIQAASGAGKSSFLKAGLWPRLDRDPDFIPVAVLRPATGILTGEAGVGRQFAAFLARHDKAVPATEIHQKLAGGDDAAHAALVDLLNTATAIVQETQRLANPDAPPPTPLIAVDQAEELFAADDAEESDRFLRLLARLLGSAQSADTDAQKLTTPPLVVWTIRADSVDTLLHTTERVGLRAPEPFLLPPMPRDAYREIITEPLDVANAAGMRLSIDPLLTDALISASKGADALPLLAYTLRQLVEDNRTGAKAHLTLEAFERGGGMGGVLRKRLASAQRMVSADDERLRRLFVPRLATWDTDANPPGAKRLVTHEKELYEGSGAHLQPLAEELVEERLLTLGVDGEGSTTLEVAHEALLRQPPISDWLEEQKDGLKLRDDVLREATEWEGRNKHAEDLVRRGEKLQIALALADNQDFSTALTPAKGYLTACRKLETTARKRARRTQAAIYTLMLGIIAGLVAFINQDLLKEKYTWHVAMRPSLLTPDAERQYAANPGPETTFAECQNGCPTMVVIPAGKLMMGSPEGEGKDDERPRHEVAFAKPFAVSRTEVTWDEWEACVRAGGCNPLGPLSAGGDEGWGKNQRPIVNVSWDDTQGYTKWLSKLTGSEYRLLSEAEWEYAARAGTTARYSWGDEIGKGNANCDGCGSEWDNKQTAPVGLFKPNTFGLYDMHGNVYEWVEDCFGNYEDAPTDGSARTSDGCSSRVLRGGSWSDDPWVLRSAYRPWSWPGGRGNYLGFRLARTLTP